MLQPSFAGPEPKGEPFPSPRIDWTIDDSSLSAYIDLVKFPEGWARECIEATIGRSATNTALDIAGGTNGRAIHDLVTEGYIGSGAYTNLVDVRDEARGGVELVTGDLLHSATWNQLQSVQRGLSPQGFDLVLHRPYGGLQDLRIEEYERGIDATLRMMRAGGLFFTQVPTTYAYGARDNQLIDALGQSITAHPEVARVVSSDSSGSLADHEHWLIYKRS